MSSPNRRYLNQVESLRAIAALMVAIFHFSSHFSWSETTTKNFTYGAQGVELFYLISGFIITFSLYHSSYHFSNYFQYISKRLIRLLPPYYMTIFLIVMVGFCMHTFLWGIPYDFNFRQIAINALFLGDVFPDFGWINPIFATLEVELQFYIIIGLLFPLFGKYDWIKFVICMLLLISGIATLGFDTVLRNGPYFVSGIALFYILEKKSDYWAWATLIAALIALMMYYLTEDLIPVIFGILYIAFVPSTTQFLKWTGKISYSYYLTHGLTGMWFLYFTKDYEFAQDNRVLLIGFAVLIAWLGAFILFTTVEKTSMKFSKRIKYKS